MKKKPSYKKKFLNIKRRQNRKKIDNEGAVAGGELREHLGEPVL